MTFSARFSIGHVDTGMTLRGGQRQLLLLARGLRKRGHEQIVVCPEQSHLSIAARDEGLAVLDLPERDFKHARGIRRLRRLVHERRIAILHAHDGAGQTVAWLASLGTSVRRVASRRVTFMPSRRLDYRLKYQYTCHAVIAVSAFVGKLVESSGIPSDMIHVIPDGIEIPCQLPDAEARLQARAAWGFAQHDFVLGHVGSFSPEKGQDLAIEAFTTLQERLPQAKLLLVGEIPPQKTASLSKAISVSGNKIRLAGLQNDLTHFFAALDLFIMPSRSEGLGSAALQAMSYALPVIATRVGGLPEIVEEGRTGWLVRPESPRELADAIVNAASDPVRLRQYGLNGRERSSNFSVGIMVEKTVDLYAQLLDARRTEPSHAPGDQY